MLSQRILDQFGRIPPDTTEPSQFYGVYNKILSGAFDILSSNYIVEPMYCPPVEDTTIDFAVTHDVAMSDQPVFFVAITPGDIHSEPARLAADARMRLIFHALQDDTPTPTLHGISVMGQKFAFYSMSKATNDIAPKNIEMSQGHAMNTIPVDRWQLDITTEEGYQQFMTVVDNVKRMVAAL